MSGSPVIRFRLKPELVELLEERGASASAVAKQIVLADLQSQPLDHQQIAVLTKEQTAECPAGDPNCTCITGEWEHGNIGASGPRGDDLLDEAIEAAEVEGFRDAEVTSADVAHNEAVREALDQQEKSGNSGVETARPNPFAGIAPRLGAEPPPKEDPVQALAEQVLTGDIPTVEDTGDDEEAMRGLWKELMRTDPGLALEIKTFDEFKRRRLDGIGS